MTNGASLVPDIGPFTRGIAGIFQQRREKQEKEAKTERLLEIATQAARGDPQALARLALFNPQAATAVSQALERNDQAELEETRVQAEKSVRNAITVQSTPFDQRPTEFIRLAQEARQQGDIPGAENILRIANLPEAEQDLELQKIVIQNDDIARVVKGATASIKSMAKATKAGQLEAIRENTDAILQGGTAPVTNVFSGDDPGSDDARRVAGLFNNAVKLAAAGQTGISNNLITQARFIADNSPDIKRAKDLNKPITRELASELQVPVGTTLGEVMDAVPRSPEEVATARAKAVTFVQDRSKALEQISFMDEGTKLISGLLSEIELDPTVVGATGSLRKAGQTAKGILSDLGAKTFIDFAEKLATTQTDLTLGEVNNLFRSPTLSTLDILENSIGFILARLTQPTGRLTVDVINRSINNVKLKGLISSEQVVDRLSFIQELISGRRDALKRRFDIDQAGDADIPIPRFRIVKGALVEIP